MVPVTIKSGSDRSMAVSNDVSTEDLRKAVLNVADAIRLTSDALDRLVRRLGHSIPTIDIRQALHAANGRLSAAVDLLVTDDDQPAS
jgi:hypothetical protein